MFEQSPLHATEGNGNFYSISNLSKTHLYGGLLFIYNYLRCSNFLFVINTHLIQIIRYNVIIFLKYKSVIGFFGLVVVISITKVARHSINFSSSASFETVSFSSMPMSPFCFKNGLHHKQFLLAEEFERHSKLLRYPQCLDFYIYHKGH